MERSLGVLGKKTVRPLRRIYAVDLFCGAGGLTHGLIKSGVDVRLGVDIDPSCEYPYTANNPTTFLLKSVKELDGKEINKYYRKNGIKLLTGCAPCQTFSRYNQKATESDTRWWLLLQFSRLVKEVLPDLVTMENVPGLMDQNVFEQFLNDLKECKYFINYSVINCAFYGVPQQRHRLVLIASRLGEINLLSPKEFGKKIKTLRQAIGEMPVISEGTYYPKDHLHQSAALSKTNLERIKSSKPGGTWRDWSEELVANCHKKDTGKSYPSVYGRMTWDAPSPTITTQFFGFGNGRFGHPEQDRAISLREGAILQSFPKNYKFAASDKPINKTQVGKLIGNAVPVSIGRLIGESFYNHISKLNKINHEKASTL
jgi:DNA (cytosine-5)-methyltransferase 1